MKSLIVILIFPLLSLGQSTYTVSNTSLTGNCSTPDTLIKTTIVTGKSGWFSSKVTLTATTSQVTKVYKPPVIVTPPNKPPTVSITGLSRITSPVSSVTLTAVASDPDGTVTKLLWQKTSGPALTINSPNGNPTLVTGLVGGNTYTFSATATDDKGATATATFTVTAIGVDTVPPPVIDTTATVNTPPVIKTAANVTVTWPTNFVILTATATDSDGILNYDWIKTSGAGVQIISPRDGSTKVIFDVPGVYEFDVYAVDKKNKSSFAHVILTVLPAVVSGSTSADPTTTPKLYNDFETEITKGFNVFIQQPFDGAKQGANYPYVSLSTEQKVSGSKSVKFVVNAGDARAGGDTHSQITKIDVENIKEGTEKWYSNDYFLQSTSASPYPTDIQYLRQWHHDASNYSPPLALCTNGGKLQLDYFTSYGDNGRDVFYDIAPVVTNQWFHVTMHIIFSATSGKALTEVWIDGVKKISKTDANKYSQYDNIAMFGLYKWIWKLTNYAPGLTTTIFADNYKEW